ncbi:MAG: putative ATPase [Candidatus Azotimanducaceae bacterium]|jgi:predicted ATPase
MNKPRRFVVTGTSGTGKTSIINELRSMGMICFDEPGRKVLTSGSELAKTEPEQFIAEMLSQSVTDYQAASSGQTVFYDRGLPDIVAYAHRFKVPPSISQQAADAHRYDSTIFLAPPWEEIFVNDEVRRATFDEYLDFHQLILNTYQELDYSILVLPKLPVHERIEFIQSAISGA